MSHRPPALIVPRRVQRVLGARWLFGAVVLLLGYGAWAATNGADTGGLLTALGIVAYNALFTALLHRRGESLRANILQLGLDSLASVLAVHYTTPLTAAVQFLFIFPLFVATLLSPREGLFLTAALCGLGHAGTQVAQAVGWSAVPVTTGEPALSALAATGVVVGALLATACVLNYLVRTLAGIESDLLMSEAKYRELAGHLEDAVRQRTGDLRQVNETLHARHRELLRLREIDAAIHQSEDLDEVLQRVVDGVAEIVPSSLAVIYLRDAGVDDLRMARFSTSAERRVAAVQSLLGAPLAGIRLPLRDGTPVAQVVSTRVPFVSGDFAAVLSAHTQSRRSRALVPDVARILDFRSCLVLPLLVGDELIGLLGLGSREVVDTRDLERVQAFATQAAIALERMRQERDLIEYQAALEQAYRDLERSQDQAVNIEKMRAIGEMTSGVAHNFNNALMAILGSAQLALMEDLPADVLHRLRIIERTAQDAALLVQRIGSFAKEEPPKTAACDVNELVADAVAMTEPRWKHDPGQVDKPITVELELRARSSVEVDAAAIREVLINLILNSVNAMGQGGRILCRTWDEGDQAVVAVRDSGCGMTEEIRRRCFEPFFTTGGEKGTGLGLSVAYGIIQRHNGDIRVVSSPGVGTEFFLSLPCSQERAARGKALPVAPVEVGEAPPLHALVVDDQAMVRDTLGQLLMALGHKATIASDGKEAVAIFDPRQHDVVITDWGMPGMSGLQVARTIKSRSPQTKVVLITGLDARLPAEVVQAEEIDTRLQKPVNLEDLRRALGTLAMQVAH